MTMEDTMYVLSQNEDNNKTKNTKKAKQKLYVLSRIIIASQMADKMKRSVGG